MRYMTVVYARSINRARGPLHAVRRSVTIIGSLAIAYLTVYGVINTPLALAEDCFRTVNEEQGAFVNDRCTIGSTPRRWVWGSTTFNWEYLGDDQYCVKVKTGLPSWYEDAVCSRPKAGTSLYAKVYAAKRWYWGIEPVSGQNKGGRVLHTTAGAIECGEMTLSAEPAATEPTSQIFTVLYGKCEAFGVPVTVSEAEYEMAAEGEVSIVNKNITVTDSAAECTVTFLAGGSNSDLSRVEYKDTEAGTILATGELSGIHYEPSGSSCGTKALYSNGTYEGEFEIKQEKMSIAVKLKPIVNPSKTLFLLAEWLASGAAVTTNLSTETTHELLFEDVNTAIGKVAVLCSGFLDGWVGPNSLGWVSEVLNLAGEAISTTALTGLALECTAQGGCESSSAPKVWLLNLGWETEVELMEQAGTFFTLLSLPHSGGGNPGWELECLVLGIATVDECTASENAAELALEGASLLAKLSLAYTELAEAKLVTCSQGGEESGIFEGEGSIALKAGGELTASSEGSVS